MEIKNLLENSNIDIPKENIKYDEPMSKHTSFKVGGLAECYVKIDDVNQLKQLLDLAQKNKIPYFILGNGSNILVTDNGIKGIVIQINIKKYEILQKENCIEATIGAGNTLSEVAQQFFKEEITGFEELSGIKGELSYAV